MMPTLSIPCFLLLLVCCSCSPIDLLRSENALELSHTCMKVRTQSKNDNQTIILLHGLGTSKETWMGFFQVLALKTGKRVCVADLRNHGDSPWSNETDVESMVSDLNLLLLTLDAKKVILLGHSMGGKIAVHFSLTYPEKVEKLIVEDMRPNGIREEALKLVLFSMKMLLSSITSVPKGSTEKEAKLIVIRHLIESFKKMNLTFPLDESAADFLPLKCFEDKCRWKMNEQLLLQVLREPEKYMMISSGLYEKPALFIYGDASPFRVGENKEEILKLFPKAKLVPVKGGGHMVHNRPEFLSEVVNFILT